MVWNKENIMIKKTKKMKLLSKLFIIALVISFGALGSAFSPIEQAQAAADITLSDDTINEGSENEELITVTLAGDTFVGSLNTANWAVTNLPAGVVKSTISRTDETTVTIALSGDRAVDYDTSIENVTVTIAAAEFTSSAVQVSASTGVTLVATADDESVTAAWATSPGTSGAEATMDAEVLTVTLAGGTLISEQVTIGNITATGTAVSAAGVTIESVTWTDATHFDVALAWTATDYDEDKTLIINVAAAAYDEGAIAIATDEITLTATVEPIAIALSDNTIAEGSESAGVINVTLTEDTFIATLVQGNWAVTNLPTGVTKGTVTRLSDTTATIALVGDRDEDYDTSITNVIVTVQAGDLTLSDAIVASDGTGVTLVATDDAESIAITNDGITEGAEGGEVITVTLTGGTFADPLVPASWVVTNLPSGVTAGDPERTSATEATITLSGNRDVDYDSNITDLTVTVASDDIDDIDVPVSIATGVTFTASNDAESVAATWNGDPGTNGAEATLDADIITVTLTDGTFVKASVDNITISAGAGITKESVTYTDSTNVDILLAWDGTDFDDHETITVSVPVTAYADSTSGDAITDTINTVATDDGESIAITNDGITEGAEGGEVITVTLTGGTFADPLVPASWVVTNLPSGVTAGDPERTSATEATITLSGNRTVDYDSNITDLTVTVAAGDIDDSGGSVSIATGVTFTATDDGESIGVAWAGTPGTNGVEATMDAEIVTVTLSDGTLIEGSVNATNITATGTAVDDAGVTIESATYVDATSFTVALAWDDTDYDVNKILTINVAAVAYDDAGGAITGDITLTATVEPPSIALTDDTINEAAETGELITVTLTGDTFVESLTQINWTVTNLPTGVSKGTVTRTGATTATIALSGNRTVDYDTSIENVTVTIAADELYSYTLGSILASTGVTLVADASAETIGVAWAGTPGTSGVEVTMDSEIVTVTLTEGTLISDQVNMTNITATGTAVNSAEVTIESVTYTDTTHFNVALAWSGLNYDVEKTLTINVAGATYDEGTDPITDDITLTATVEPTVEVTMGANTFKVEESTLVTFTFSSAPTGFTVDDVTTIDNGLLSGFTVTGDTKIYTATFTPTDDTEAATNVITVGTDWTDGTSAPLAGDSSPNYTIDTKEPTITITSNDEALYTGDAVATITFDIIGGTVDFALEDVVAVGGNLNAFTEVSAGVQYTAIFTASNDSTTGATINVAAGTFTDAAGNNNTVAIQETMTVDTLAPTINTVTSNATETGTLKVGDAIIFTVTPTIQEAGLTVLPATYNGGALSWSTGDSGVTYTATYTVAEDQTDQDPALQLLGVTLTDAVSNTGAGVNGTDVAKLIDANSPDITSVTSNATVEGTLKVTDMIVFTITPVVQEAGLTVAPTTYNGGTLEWSSVDGTTYIATYTVVEDQDDQDPALQLTSVTLTDAAGNDGVSADGADVAKKIDANTPTAAFTAATDNVGSVMGPLNTGDTTDDTELLLTGANETGSTVEVFNGAASLGAATVNGTGWTYSATVVNGTTYQFNIKETDAAGNISDATDDFTVIGDTAAPTAVVVANEVAIYDSDAGTDAFIITATFSEAMDNTKIPTVVFDAALDSTLTSPEGAWSTVAHDNDTYTWTYDIADAGVTVADVDVTVDGGDDIAGNDQTAKTNTDYIDVDTENPTTTISDDEDGVANITGGNITYTFTFGEGVTDFTVAEAVVTGGTKAVDFASGVSGEAVYTLVVTPDSDSTTNITVNVAGGVAIDINGNDNVVAAESTQTVDTLRPTVGITDDNAGTVNDGNPEVLYTFEFSENVTGFTTDDVTVTAGGIAGEFSATDGSNTYTLAVTADDGSTTNISLTISNADLIDANSNTMAADATDTDQAVDRIEPTLSSAARDNNTQITVTLSELANGSSITDASDGGFVVAETDAAETTYAVSDITPGVTNDLVVLTVADLGVSAKEGITVTYSSANNGAVTDVAENDLATDTTGVTIAAWDTTAPTVIDVTSNLEDGSYKVDQVVDIDVTFSENVISSGDVTITFDTGGTCTFTVDDSDTGTCNYTVLVGHTSADLTVSSITGVVNDIAGNTLVVPATPTTNLAANKAFVIDTTAPALSVDAIVGTTVSEANDTIVLNFDGPVVTHDGGAWAVEEFDSISGSESGTLVLTTATFEYTSNTLTITLDETTDHEYLKTGETLTVNPATDKIKDAADNSLVTTAVEATNPVGGDSVAPTISSMVYTQGETTVTVIRPSVYGLTTRVTTTFDEAMEEGVKPQIAIDAQGTSVDVTATNMTKTSSTVWYYDWTVPNIDAIQGEATITLTGTDLAGIAFNSASTQTVTIDEKSPVIANGGVTLDKDSYRITQDANVEVTVVEDNTASTITVNGVSAIESETAGTWIGTFAHGQVAVSTYSFDVVLTDAYGNVTTQMVQYRVVADTATEPTEISVTTALVKRIATKNGEFDDGWRWVLDVTLPTASTTLSMSFDDLTGAGTIDATNIRFYSAESDHTSAGPIVIAASGAGTEWSESILLDTDLYSNIAGRQIQITVQAAVPEGSTSGAYSASYDIQASLVE